MQIFLEIFFKSISNLKDKLKRISLNWLLDIQNEAIVPLQNINNPSWIPCIKSYILTCIARISPNTIFLLPPKSC